MKKLLYHTKYYLTRSYFLSFVITLILFYQGFEPIKDFESIIFWYGLIWFGLWAIRDTLLGFSVIPDTSEIYSGGENGEGIVDIIKNADLYLYVISPFVEFGNNLSRHILDAQDKVENLTILVSRGRGMDKKSIKELQKLKDSDCNVQTHPDLHSKIYLNEDVGLITSMNLYQPSINKSLEVGVRITNSEKLKEVEELIKKYLSDRDTKPFQAGFCIKTKELIDYNPLKPIDSDVFKYNDRQHSWKYCHKCGKESEVTVSNPLCDEHK